MNTEHVAARMKYMWDCHAGSYAERIGYDLNTEQRVAWQKTLSGITALSDGYVLDVGTGPGFLALLFDGMGYQCIGVDSSEEMLKAAAVQARLKSAQCRFVLAEAAALPFSDDSFDVVVNRHLLWALTEPGHAMREWVRVLKPDGKLIVMDGMWDSSTSGPDVSNDTDARSVSITGCDLQAPGMDRGNVREVYRFLPMRNAPAEKVMELFAATGLVNVRAHDIEELMDADMRGRNPEKRKNYNRNRYMIVGEKQRENI